MESNRAPGWWEDAVFYEVYPRSFQDSDGDGIGDLAGIERRLDHLEWLGVDAIWLAPFYASPLADFGYDVADHTAVAPEYGSLADFDSLLAAAHARGIRIVADLVVSHTSIEHPWFRDHPERYVWADGPEPPNNWIASFGGPTWSRDECSGSLYLHSFYPSQPDLDWRNPEVREAMAAVIRFWVERGVDGFRIDAVDRLVKDLELRDDPPGAEPFPLPVHPDQQHLDLIHSRDAPEIEVALAILRAAAGDRPLIGEVYLPAERARRYLGHLDAAFAFDLLHARWEAGELRTAIERSRVLGRSAWVTSNHDFPRVATRWGSENLRSAAVLLLTLGGPAFIYQGEEIGMVDGPGGDPPLDGFGRDGCRHPMQWSADVAAGAGFTTGEPWLPLVDPGGCNVADQRARAGSTLLLFRELIALRRRMAGRPELLDSPPGTLAFGRGGHVVVVNLGPERAGLPAEGPGPVLLETAPGAVDAARREIAPHAAAVLEHPSTAITQTAVG